MDDLIQSVRPDGAVLFANRAWRETLGYTAEEASRLNIFDAIHPSSRDHCREILMRALGGNCLELTSPRPSWTSRAGRWNWKGRMPKLKVRRRGRSKTNTRRPSVSVT